MSCKACDGEVDAFFAVLGKPRKYCLSCGSKTCGCGKAKAWATRTCLDCEKERRKAERLPMRAIKCSWCGCAFHLSTARINQNQEFCSKACSVKARRKIALACPVYFPTCTQCQRPFTAQLDAIRLCSAVCRMAEAVLSRVSKHPGKRTCKECHTVFPVEYRNWTRFCPDVCEHIAKRRARRKARKQGSKGSDRHRKRARKHGVEYEPIRLSKVLARDGWTCGICHQPISRASTYPDPMMASLDHIVPMSKGGPHLYANVQPAHHRCNTLKGNGDRQRATAA